MSVRDILNHLVNKFELTDPVVVEVSQLLDIEILKEQKIKKGN